MADRKLPAIQFYVGDWRKDVNVQSLDFFDRGVWFEVLCLMHESDDRGRLVLNDRPMPDPVVARLLGLDLDRWREVREHLVAYGVASEDDDGALFCRRMVKDEGIRRARAEAGRKGGRARKQTPSKSPAKPKQTPKQTGNENGAPDMDEGGDAPSKTEASEKQNRPPSVSVSTSVPPLPPSGGISPLPPEKQTDPALERLVDWLGDDLQDAADRIRTMPRSGPGWATRFLAQWGPDAELEPAVAKLGPDRKREVIRLAVSRYAADGDGWNGAFFRKFVAAARSDLEEGNGDGRPQEGYAPPPEGYYNPADHE